MSSLWAIHMPTGAGCCGCSLWGQEPDDTLSISYERIALLVFKEHDSLSTQKSKQEFPLICPWLHAYIIPLISFAWDQKQIHSLLVEMILQSCDPSQKGEQESASHAQTSMPEAVCGVALFCPPEAFKDICGPCMQRGGGRGGRLSCPPSSPSGSGLAGCFYLQVHKRKLNN